MNKFTRIENLVQNPDFEKGDGTPQGWESIADHREGTTFIWDSKKSNTGTRSACIENIDSGTAIWQQIVDIPKGQVYEYAAYLAFEGLSKEKSKCRLQLQFLDSENKVLTKVDFPYHFGTRDFAIDFPYKLKVRAPQNAKRAQVNLCLSGPGKVWFDDVYLVLAPTGKLSGIVTSEGSPVENVRVYFCNNQWDKTCEAVTDSNGEYTIPDMPVAFPRYIALAEKEGYMTRVAGDIEIQSNETTTLDFELKNGKDPKDNLRIKFGSIAHERIEKLHRIPDDATIPSDMSGYPEIVYPYLQSDEYIQADHPDIRSLANRLLESLPEEDRGSARKVSWVIHEWVSKNIDHDGVFILKDSDDDALNSAFKDETSGVWQTISGNGDGPGWCWGKNFYDWCYRPHEVLKVKCAICVEHAWLCSALYRTLNIPARAAVGSYEIYVQTSKEKGFWIHASTTEGRNNYRENGNISMGFGGGGPPAFRFSTLSRPILHEDWNAENKILWRERHPWSERYESTEQGYGQASEDLRKFTDEGKAPLSPISFHNRPAGEEGQRALAVQDQSFMVFEDGMEMYETHYSDVTMNFLNIGDQRSLDVRFPMVTDSESGKFTGDTGYWTNHPECIKKTWIEEIENPPAVGIEQWYHIEFDISSLLD